MNDPVSRSVDVIPSISRAVHAGESETAIASTVSGIFVGCTSAG